MRKQLFISVLAISLTLLAGIAPGVSARQISRVKYTNQYVALGDSVAAGAGLPLATDSTTTEQLCARSKQGYPNTVASKLRLSFLNVSCSGATVGDLVTGQNVNGVTMQAQLDAAFANGVPKVITLTAGANDIHWSDFIKACYASECDNATYSAAATAYIAAMKTKLHYALTSIRIRSHGRMPRVVVTGYYNPLSAACTGTNFTASEITWLESQQQALNTAIQNVSRRYSFTKFVPVNFAGHDICSANSWLQGLTDVAPFHPNAAGQEAIARAVIRNIR